MTRGSGAGVVDAVLLTGGRGARLGGVDKPAMRVSDETLLDRALTALRPVRRIVVVGPDVPLPDGVVHTREHPPYAGPAAAVAAGLAALERVEAEAPESILLAACDIPRLSEIVPVLLAAVGESADGVLALDETGRVQYLASAVRGPALRAAVDRSPDLVGLPMRRLFAGLDLTGVPVPEGSARDVDTWTDAEELGVQPQGEDAGGT